MPTGPDLPPSETIALCHPNRKLRWKLSTRSAGGQFDELEAGGIDSEELVEAHRAAANLAQRVRTWRSTTTWP